MAERTSPVVRVYWYSQTGQLKETVDALVAPLADAGWDIRWCAVRPKIDYPFPWPLRRFVGLVPEAVHPESVIDVEIDGGIDEGIDGDASGEPDLVLLAFQVWYLAPSVPMRSAVVGFPERFAGRPVLGVTACRNMWYSAALAVRRHVAAAGGRYLGTVAAIDDAPPAATFVTTMRWLLTGRREAFGPFPRAGVGPRQLDRVRSVGEKLAARVTAAGPDLADRVVEVLGATDAAPVEPAIAAADLLAGKVFRVWSAVARAGRPGLERGLVLAAFTAWLLAAVAFGLPAVVLTRALAGQRFDAVVRRVLAPVVVGR